MTIYLYKKTHNKTGLQYLGKTISPDPHRYRGSGKYWKNHIKAHGYDVSTEILRKCQSKEEIKEWGTYYSKLWNVVESKDWANLKEETGEGGAILITEEHRKKISKAFKGRTFSPDHRKKLSDSLRGHPDYRTPQVKAEAARKASMKLKGKKKPDGFGEAVSKRRTGATHDELSRTKMKSAWTPERKAAQAERARKLNEQRRQQSAATKSLPDLNGDKSFDKNNPGTNS